jgi:predicted TIM-barrel fold metal-dependent hydrolase
VDILPDMSERQPVADAHVHFFSSGFFRALGAARPTSVIAPGDAAVTVPEQLGWTSPGTDEALADTWADELDRHAVSNAMLIASAPGDEKSVATALARHPSRFIGAFMYDPAAPDAANRLASAFALGLKTVCLFPAMHKVAVDDPRSVEVFETAARAGGAVFVHCGVLSIGARKKLGLSSAFDIRLGDPLAVAAVALRYPSVPVIVPHFGAGFFREALMAVTMAPNVVLDTSSSNGWIALYSGLTLKDVFARTIDVAGPSRLLFGTDSSFFPRGWQHGVYATQRAILDELGMGATDQAAIFGGNLRRLMGIA